MDAKYRIDTPENKRFMKDMTQSLLEFGKHFASPTGSAYYLGDDGTPWADRPRETWITCRMAHVYSMGCMLGYPDSDKLVGKALKGLTGELRDKEFGGWYSGITNDWIADLECNKDHPADQFKPYGATPGHGIEWARLIVQWAVSTYQDDEKKEPFIEAAEQLFIRAITDAWNADGAPGIVYTTDWEGKPVVHDRMHWTLAEAINTLAVLYRITGKKEYADRYAEFMQYLDEKVLDHTCGSWFHQLDESNQLLSTVWPGKSDLYHAFQATLIPYNRVDLSIACAIKEKKDGGLE